jgi:hypothetical protein
MKVPDLRMKCQARTCQDPYNKVERRAPRLWLCPVHWQVHLDRARHWEETRARLRSEETKRANQEALQVAFQVAGPARPPKYKLTHRGVIWECSGGLPSLGKDQ